MWTVLEPVDSVEDPSSLLVDDENQEVIVVAGRTHTAPTRVGLTVTESFDAVTPQRRLKIKIVMESSLTLKNTIKLRLLNQSKSRLMEPCKMKLIALC